MGPRSESGAVVVIDDDRELCDWLLQGLGQKGFRVLAFTDPDEALAALGREPVDVVVTDLRMARRSGFEVCERVVAGHPDVPVVVVTAFGSLDTAIAAIRAGAYDFVTKPFELDALQVVIERAVGHRHLRDEVRRLRQALAGAARLEELIGESPAMLRLFDLVSRVAPFDTTVLLRGETGTGKELVARALHRLSARSAGPWVAVNCAALPEPLLESELFGHVRGAFTDARESRAGLLVEAHRGTLFLDEVGDMPLGVQAKLLRALQERAVRPIGGSRETAFDARVVAATNRDLVAAVEEGRFREDLLFRIDVVGLDVPPLRSRGNDVLLLAQHFLERGAAHTGKRVVGLTSGAAERLLAYPWPGNVRELQNCVERAVALTEHDRLVAADLPERVREYRRSHVLLAADDASELVTMEEVERRYVLRVLEAVAGNKTLAAQILGFDRRTLYRKLERFGPRPDQSPG